VDKHIKSLTSVLGSLMEDVDLMKFNINRDVSRESLDDIIARYHADLKQHMQQIAYIKRQRFRTLKRKKK